MVTHGDYNDGCCDRHDDIAGCFFTEKSVDQIAAERLRGLQAEVKAKDEALREIVQRSVEAGRGDSGLAWVARRALGEEE